MARKRLGEILIEEGLIDDRDLEEAIKYKEKSGYRLGTALVALRIIAEWQLTEALGKALQLPVVDLKDSSPSAEALALIPSRLAERFDLIPLRIDGVGDDRELVIAMSDPLNRAVIRRMQDVAGLTIRPALAGLSAIQRAIRDHYHGAEKSETFEDAESVRISIPSRQMTHPWASMEQEKKESTISRIVREVEHIAEEPAAPEDVPSHQNLVDYVLSLDLKVRTLLHLMLKKGLVSDREFVACLKHFLDAQTSGTDGEP
jgi:type IV pilus assembly protein PilB